MAFRVGRQPVADEGPLFRGGRLICAVSVGKSLAITRDLVGSQLNEENRWAMEIVSSVETGVS